VTVGGRSLARDVQLCGGYVSGQDGRLHFGLGTATSIDKITIRWPSGREQVVDNPALDRVITVEEPK